MIIQTTKKCLTTGLILGSLSCQTFAAKNAFVTFDDKIQINWESPNHKAVKSKMPASKRKVASEMIFSENDLSSDFKKIRTEWLLAKTPQEVEALLKTSYDNYNNYSDDAKYFLAQMHISLSLSGIIWRMRPLFEKGNKLIGNKSTHVTAVQAVRGFANNINMFLPTDQANASFKYFSEPSVSMTSKDQFNTILDFQNFIAGTFSKSLYEASTRIEAILKKNPEAIFVWDNKMQFGTGTFQDEINRYSGHGEAEVRMSLSAIYHSLHDALVFCAYNQDQIINIVGKMGSHLGHDSITWLGREKQDLGITDEERRAIIYDATRTKKFLNLREEINGKKMMAQAYAALSNYVFHIEKAFNSLQGKSANPSMGLNPIHFSSESQNQLEKGIQNMVAVVRGPAEVRDPVSGKTVTLNLPAFYANPPKNLNVLMANKFEQGPNEYTLKSKSGEILKFRNYSAGRSIGWDNNAWKTYVPSAEGQDSSYMSEARRIMRYSLGTSMVMNLPAIFVK